MPVRLLRECLQVAGVQFNQRECASETMSVFVSFDYDNDEGAKIMLAGQAKHPDSPFDFKDASIKDHLTGDWKDKVKRRMDNVDVVAVLCGAKTHTAAGVAARSARGPGVDTAAASRGRGLPGASARARCRRPHAP